MINYDYSYYFSAKYYDSDLSIWLSVDPMASKYPSMSAYMYCAGNPVMLVDPDGRKFKPTNQEGRDLFNSLIDKFGKNMFHLKSDKDTRFIEIQDKFKLKKFKKELKNNGYRRGTDEYKQAVQLFKLIKSEDIFEIGVVSTNSHTKKIDNYSIRTKNEDLSEFRNKYKSDEHGQFKNTPTQNNIDEFLKKGNLNGHGWSFFKNDINTTLKGMIIINPQDNESTYNIGISDGPQKLEKSLQSLYNYYNYEKK